MKKNNILSKEELSDLKEKSITERTYKTAKIIKTFIKENNLSDSKFAEICGMSGSTISAYVNGTSEMKSESIIKISKVLGVSTDYLLGLSDFKTPSDCDINIHNYIGLSEDSIKNLHAIKDENFILLNTINCLLENELYFDNEIYMNEVVDFPYYIDKDGNIDESLVNSRLKEYTDQIKNNDKIRNEKNPIYLLSMISQFLNADIKEESLYYMNGKLVRFNELSDKELAFAKVCCKKFNMSNAIIDDFLIKKIIDCLMKLKYKGGSK